MCNDMPDLNPGSILLVIVAAAFTAAAAVWDMRQRRIPNALTLPVFVAGLIYQAFHGQSGLIDAGLGFAVGFGTLFILWLIGGGGGGDTKLMGALSVWLGFQMTLFVLIISTVIVVLMAGGSMVWSTVTGKRSRNTRQHPDDKQQQSGPRKQKVRESVGDKKERRVVAYALPVALATWLVLLWNLPSLP